MKKLLAIVMATLMLLGCLVSFAGCGNKKALAALDEAVTYLDNLYKNDAKTTSRDYDVAGKIKIGDLEYTVTWEVDTDKVTIKESATAGFYTVDVPDETAEKIPYVLTATVADADGNTAEVKFEREVPVLQPTKIDEAAKIVISVKDKDTTKYVTGVHTLYTSASSGKSKWELNVTENKAEALAMTVQKNDDNTVSFVAEGKYLFCDATDVKFVDTASDNTKFVLETATGGDFIKCAVANYNGKAQYLEFYSGYLTCYGMDATKAEIYTFNLEDAGDAAGKIDIPTNTTPNTPNPPANKPTELTTVTAPVAGTAYKLFLSQVSLGKNLFAIGELDQDKFYKTTENAKEAPDFYVEAAGDGFKFYTTIDGAKKYVDATLVPKDDGKTSKVLSYTDTTDTVWTYQANVNAWFTTIDGATYVLGTYGTYSTFCISETRHITAENTGVSQFPGHFVAKDVAENYVPETPETPSTPSTPSTPADPNAPAAAWTLTTTLKNGDQVLIGAAKHGKLLSADKVDATSYYNKGVDYSATDFSKVTDAEIFVVTVNSNGSYTFTSLTGDVIALADSYASLNKDGVNKSWTLEAKSEGVFLVKNVGRGNYLEWYSSKNNWSTFTAGDTDEYEISFYVKGE